MSKKVAVMLSGGVDSAVTAKLLLEDGFEVVGLTGRMTCSEDFEQVALNSKKVADKLNIEHYVLDVSTDFKEKVINYFENSYKYGKTPNPCIMCNKHIKWGVLFNYAIKELDCDYIATGHYANIRHEGGIYKLYPASDEHKDQLYFLFMLGQECLCRTLFPLSRYKKDEVRALAEKYDLPPKSSKESQDICFIKPPMTAKKYLNSLFQPSEGNFIEKSTGQVLGTHSGHWQYTIGQRKGIGIAHSEPLYVVGTQAENNNVLVGVQSELVQSKLILSDINWSYACGNETLDVYVKIRYNMQAVRAKLKKIKNGWEVNFTEPVSAVTPGQACVFYDINDGHLMGGAWI